jgi:hypothetical protein
MTVLLRSFVVWLMLLALPYQGYASAQMLLCVVPAPGRHHAMACQPVRTIMQPCWPRICMMATSHPVTQHEMQRLGMLRRCRAGSGAGVPAPVLPSLSAAVVLFRFPPAVDLAHPERPPQGRYA